MIQVVDKHSEDKVEDWSNYLDNLGEGYAFLPRKQRESCVCVCVCVCLCVCCLFSPAAEKRAVVDLEQQVNQLDKKLWGFPGGSVIRIHLLMQETLVWSLILEDPHIMEQPSLCATTTNPGNLCSRAWKPHRLSRPTLEPVLHKRSPCSQEQPPLSTTREKPVQQGKPSTAKNK